ncbi:tryptophan synthase subunit alpha [Dethiosulfatarculus sandiegensis]|uniref:Tryptophan synthase alpha chain n=1 Tax=Dethiosulfatarculus sandiegensis TaxID=1429043 RepID=A0A0D2J444_9BACT|nr:tryptophan synthase subunit alpha [Dethiosulfatarculus sandiegensis]KIX12919.1 tryptophan synthase subunit alpha [Dethiosulfatarculus sandiegensis]
MTTTLQNAFDRAKEQNRAAFIPFISGGHPDMTTSMRILKAVEKGGADVIEVGIPFSDPVADGPVIQSASTQALANGATPAGVLEMVRQAEISCPVVIMTYFNPMLRMGLTEFAKRAAQAGVKGVIIPDLTADEAGEWSQVAEEYCIDTIFLAAPTTPDSRLEIITKASKGFVYYVSTTGVTGSAINVSDGLLEEIKRIKRAGTLPVAVGFGVSTPEQAAALGKAADGVIVGSALVKAIQQASTADEQIESAEKLTSAMAAALKN